MLADTITLVYLAGGWPSHGRRVVAIISHTISSLRRIPGRHWQHCSVEGQHLPIMPGQTLPGLREIVARPASGA